MAIAVELPALGESVVEGTVSRWLVQEGDYVELDQPLVEVTTDKVDAEIPSPSAGRVQKIFAAEGDVIEVGGKLAEIDGEASRDESPPQPAPSQTRADPPPKPAEKKPQPERSRSAHADAKDDDFAAPRATPVARRLAEESQVELAGVSGSGSGGRITKADVMRHAGEPERSGPDELDAAPPGQPIAQAAPRPPARESAPRRPAYASYSLHEGDRVIPMSPMRRIIAEHMVYSKRTSPHVGTVAEVDMGAVSSFRSAHKDAFEASQGIKLTFLPFIVHAVVRALREFPALNASVVEDAIIEKRDINVGLAVETEKGLVVPVVRTADRLSLSGLAAAIDDIASRARNKRLSADDLQGGTFTVSNPGRQGNLYGFAIINQPQVGILRMGEMVKRPVVRVLDGHDAIVIRPMMHLALSYDHRAVDGAPANGFLFRIRELLEAADFDL
jgi:2-oxoglutarate dehydrogenase E2 component (dihydrolipoamide succinyltransferase)